MAGVTISWKFMRLCLNRTFPILLILLLQLGSKKRVRLLSPRNSKLDEKLSKLEGQCPVALQSTPCSQSRLELLSTSNFNLGWNSNIGCRCFYLAQFYSAASKFPEAYVLFKRSEERADKTAKKLSFDKVLTVYEICILELGLGTSHIGRPSEIDYEFSRHSCFSITSLVYPPVHSLTHSFDAGPETGD